MRILKSALLIFIFLVAFSLIGCSQSSDSSKEAKNENKKTVEVKKEQQDSKVVEEQKTAQVKEKETNTAAPTEEKQAEQAAPKANSTTQTVQTSQPKTTPSTPSKTTTQPAKTSGTSSSTQQIKPPAAATTPKPNTPTQTPKPVTSVTLSIIGPKDRGTILGATKVNFNDGDTIFDIITQAAKKQGITVDSRGSGATAYIEGIDNIYEFDYGAKSGWVFKHNGASITKSVGVIKVKDGDRIECYYTEGS
ncbi:DUF4430 domain-containing protein [Neobacillus bataviensis]|uniref:DUF4430 domain-containing protein n=1 Tax=Neobacillus bataviensis TaxID=220685 RepID=UPI001CBA7D0D|nr:DUF4430 domain-containing protein [Neobacillus bataviensis]